MKVLLVADVEKPGQEQTTGTQIGFFGDIVEVSNGFARNYLLPQGLAVIPNEAAIKSLQKEKDSRAEARKKTRQKLEETAAAVNGAEVVIAAKANEAGLLFGSVTSRDIAENLREQGFDVADKVIVLGEHIKQVGNHTAALRFAEDLTANVNVVVVPQQKAEDKEPGTEDSGQKAEKSDI